MDVLQNSCTNCFFGLNMVHENQKLATMLKNIWLNTQQLIRKLQQEKEEFLVMIEWACLAAPGYTV